MFSLGDQVCSTAGRDAKKCFLVVGILDEQYVLISDGKLRKTDKPKKKKIKHLTSLGINHEEIKQKLTNKVPVTNKEIRSALNKINANKGEE